MIVAVLCTLLLSWMAFDLNRYVTNLPKKKGSLQRWLPIAQMLHLGPEIYAQRPDYLYPPLFLIAVRPLADVQMPTRAIIYELAKQLALIASVILAWKIVKGSFGALPVGLLAVGVILTARYLESDLGHGNVNIFVLLFVLLGCWLWQRGWLMIAGVPLALAVSIKLTPALLLVYAAYKRRWMLLLGAAVGLFLFLVILPACVLGWSQNLATLTAWKNHVMVPFTTELRIDAIHMNQSLAAVLIRYLTAVMAMDNPERYINLADMARKDVVPIYRGVSLVLLCVCLFGLRGAITNAHSPRFAIHLSIVFVLMLLFSGYSWHAHFVYLLIPYLTLVAVIYRMDRQRLRKYLIVAVGVSYVLGSLMTSIFGGFLADLFESYGCMTVAAMIILISLIIVSAKPPARSVPATPTAAADPAES